MTPPRRNPDVSPEMAEYVQELRRRIHRANDRQVLDIDTFEIALNYARTRYFEIENEITNARISRLEAPPSYVDILIYIGLGGVAGPVAQALTTGLLRRLLKNHLVFVDGFTQVGFKAKDAARVREFFKIRPGYSIKSTLNVPVRDFLNQKSVWGRLYRHVPEFIGSRFDEIVQAGPDLESALRDRPEWPDRGTVAEALLNIEAWVKVQRMVISQEYREYDSWLDRGDIESVNRIEGVLLQIDETGSDRSEADLTKDVVQRAKHVGEYFLLALIAQRYGPAQKLATVKRSSSPTKELDPSRDLYRRAFESRYVAEYRSGSKAVVETLVRNLIHPVVRPPGTFLEIAADRLPSRYRGKIADDPHVLERTVDDAAVELLPYIDGVRREISRNPTPFRELLGTRKSSRGD
jgi:hypothetical protein